MAYNRTTWQDSPSTSTPINAANLNNIETGLVDAHNFSVICTSTTRPASPFAGQQIYETDTRRSWTYITAAWVPDDGIYATTAARDAAITAPFAGQRAFVTADSITYQYSGTAWVAAGYLGAWSSWTPTVTQGATPSFTVTRARFIRQGLMVTATFDLAFTATTGTASNAIVLGFAGLGVAASTSSAFGSFVWFDAGNTNFAGTLAPATTTTLNLFTSGQGNPMGFNQTISTGDILRGTFVFESAA